MQPPDATGTDDAQGWLPAITKVSSMPIQRTLPATVSAPCALDVIDAGNALETIPALHQALAWQPGSAAHWLRLGLACARAGKHSDAAAAFRKALHLAPDSIEARTGLAQALSRQGRFLDAAHACNEGLTASPHCLPLLHALAMTLGRAGLFAQAEEVLRQARTLDAQDPDTQWHTAWLHARRHRLDEALAVLAALLAYRPDHARAQQLQSRLLLAAGRAAWTWAGAQALPQRPDSALQRKWRRHLAPWQGCKVGLIWADDSSHPDAPDRSFALAECAALAGIPGVTFFGLQTGAAAAEAAQPPEDLAWAPLSAALPGRADAAAAMARMDLVICVDGDGARQAAAMGCRTWIILPEQAQAQAHWMRERDDMPGYPSVRLFRQTRQGEWGPVLQQVACALLQLLDAPAMQARLTPLQRTLQQAAQALHGYRYAEAEQRYRELLQAHVALTPELAGALRQHAVRTGRHALLASLDGYRGAVTDIERFWLEDLRAGMLAQKGEVELALGMWERLLAQVPALPVFMHYGEAAQRAGQQARAVTAWEKALALYPDAPQLQWQAARSYQAQGMPDQALACLQRAVEIAPLMAQAQVRLGTLLREQGRIAEARRHLQRGLRADPYLVDGWNELGHVAFTRENHYKTAQICFRRSIELQPVHYPYSQLAYCHFNLREYDQAIAMFEQTLRLKPDDREALYFKAQVLQNTACHQEAIQAYEKAIAQSPDDDEFTKPIYRQLSTLYLTVGNVNQGYQAAARTWEKRGELSRPEWKGEPLAGKTLLVYQGHGYGDSIQYMRLLRQLRPAKLIYAVWPDLVRLYKDAPGIDALHSIFNVDLETLEYDYHINEYGLIHTLRVDPLINPVEVPYLKADPDLVRFWQQRMADDRNFKVGIVWSGNPIHGQDKDRSSRLADWLPLAGLPNVSLYNLQKDDACQAIYDFPQTRMIDFSRARQDFADLAAIVSCLDLVISIDSSPSHLAGALGKPVWLLLGWTGVDWRWQREAHTSAWYPSMRVFRQMKGQSWREVLSLVRDELMTLTGNHALVNQPCERRETDRLQA